VNSEYDQESEYERELSEVFTSLKGFVYLELLVLFILIGMIIWVLK